MNTVLVVIEFILAFVMIGLVLVQQSKSDGLKAFTGGGAGETFFSKNKMKTGEAFLTRITTVVAVLFAINTILMNIL